MLQHIVLVLLPSSNTNKCLSIASKVLEASSFITLRGDDVTPVLTELCSRENVTVVICVSKIDPLIPSSLNCIKGYLAA